MENQVNKVSEDKFKDKLSEYVNDTLSELLLYDNVTLKMPALILLALLINWLTIPLVNYSVAQKLG